jgi:hypothetical protein
MIIALPLLHDRYLRFYVKQRRNGLSSWPSEVEAAVLQKQYPARRLLLFKIDFFLGLVYFRSAGWAY